GAAARDDAALSVDEADLLGSGLGVDQVAAQTVVDTVEVAAAGVGGAVDRGVAVLGVIVRLLAVPVGAGVAVGVDDVVEVPAPGRVAGGVGEAGGLVARLAGVVAEDRDVPGGVGGRVVVGGVGGALVAPAGHPVLAEEVLGAGGVGHFPVLAVVVA